MSRPFSYRLFIVALAITVTFIAKQANCAPLPDPIDPKSLSKDCVNAIKGEVVDLPSNQDISHQYMLLLVFNKGSGGKYFGKPKVDQNGCIPDILGDNPITSDIVNKQTQLTVSNCPNDCVYPRNRRHATEGNYNDPLYMNPWGILSAVDSATLGGGRDRRIEVWEVAVRDACHAHDLYKYHTMCPDRLLSKALNKHDMLGEILVGYPLSGNENELAEKLPKQCPLVNMPICKTADHIGNLQPPR